MIGWTPDQPAQRYASESSIVAGDSRLCFQWFENLAIVTPSITRWSALQLTCMMLTGTTLPLASKRGSFWILPTAPMHTCDHSMRSDCTASTTSSEAYLGDDEDGFGVGAAHSADVGEREGAHCEVLGLELARLAKSLQCIQLMRNLQNRLGLYGLCPTPRISVGGDGRTKDRSP